MANIQATGDAKYAIVLRAVAGVPLLLFGMMHLTGAAPMEPLIEAAGLPAAGLLGVLAPIAQVVAGVSLLLGAFARVGSALAIGTMLGAVATHVKVADDAWPTPQDDGSIAPGPEPVALMYVAIVIILLGAVLLWRGAGKWSVDRSMAGTAGNRPSAGVSGG